MSRHCQISPRGAKSPSVENHWFNFTLLKLNVYDTLLRITTKTEIHYINSKQTERKLNKKQFFLKPAIKQNIYKNRTNIHHKNDEHILSCIPTKVA